VAYQEDNEIIIESFLDGTEVSVGVINYKGVITVLPITEIVSENDLTMKLNILVNHKSPQREFLMK
jgi:D-alanine-D-alanine ligase-like ATP-grasp enzyme